MIENRLITDELSLKRYRRFKKDKAAVISVWVLAILVFLSLTAEFWANSKPIMMSYQGKTYVPLLVDYHPTEFGRDDLYIMDYRALEIKGDDWVAWPLIQWDPFESNSLVDTYPSPPTKQNLFGTDDRGRDVLTRLLYGFRYSLAYAVGVWFLAYLFGCSIGALMGYLGGKTDLILSRVVEIFESIPSTLLLITIIAIFTPSLPLLIIFSILFDWTGIAAYMRGQFLSWRKREFVEAARALGASHTRIIFKHILPNALTPIVTFAPFAITGNISSLAFLDYLGLGLRAPTPSWGELLAQAQKYFTIGEWLVWFPSIALVLTLICLNNIGQAVRDAYDSKTTM
jgi:microcin C transport system permease protein